jgi:hypothetical protein
LVLHGFYSMLSAGIVSSLIAGDKYDDSDFIKKLFALKFSHFSLLSFFQTAFSGFCAQYTQLCLNFVVTSLRPLKINRLRCE